MSEQYFGKEISYRIALAIGALAPGLILFWIGSLPLILPASNPSNLAPTHANGFAYTARRQNLPMDQLLALNLFGSPAAPAVLDPKKLPDTSLNLKLVGIIHSTVSGESRGLISIAGKPAKPFFSGDVLQDGSVIQGFEEGLVLIQHGDHLEKLALHQPGSGAAKPRWRRP